jgi:N4-gp56 family major capsid protein
MANSTFTESQAAPYATALREWDKRMWAYPRFESFIGSHFIGTMDRSSKLNGLEVSSDPNAIVVVKNNFKGTKGTVVKMTMIGALTNTAKVEGETMAGNEEALVGYEMELTLKQFRHAVSGGGQLADRRSVYNAADEARKALGPWGANLIDDYAVAALSGLASADGNIAAVAPSRKWVGGQTSAGVMAVYGGTTYNFATDAHLLDSATVTDQLFGTNVISTVKRMAQLTEPVVKPVMVGGKPFYVMLISPLQAKALKADTAWIAAQQNAGPRDNTNPLFSGALGIWDGVVIHEWEKIEQRYGSGDLVATATTTITMTATTPGTSGTCTAAGGTPFNTTNLSTANITAGVYIVISGVGKFKVLSRTSDTVCVVTDTTSATAAGGTAFYLATASDDGSQFDALDYLEPNVRIDRGLFLGAGALSVAFGQIGMIYDDDAGHDYKERWGICLRGHTAMSKTRFNSVDRGVIVVDTQVVSD